jgi:diacylglycerol kinase family enzyme
MALSHRRFAVVLNRNAKKVTQEVERISGELVHPDDLFLSSSAEDSERIAATLIERRYEAVFAGGGDGTVMHLINQLARYPLDRQPAVGILKLGTGNAMARMVSSGNVAGDLQTYIGSETRECVDLSLVECEGVRSPFLGLGIDAEILNDYRYVKQNFGQSVFKPVFQNVGGYFFGVFARTIPRHARTALSGKAPVVRAVVKSGACLQVGAEGKVLRAFEPGQLIYEGPLMIALAGTVPFYGYGMKVLPHATTDPQRMHLRIADLGTAKTLAVLPSLWKGEYSGADVSDFLVEEVELTFTEEMPFQMGGDASGYRTQVAFKTIPKAVRLIKLL